MLIQEEEVREEVSGEDLGDLEGEEVSKVES